MFKLLKGILSIVLLLLPFLGWLMSPHFASAAWNPNNLISDSEFTNWRTLDSAGIQQFLNSRGASRLRTFSENGKTAAQIIAEQARSNGINPFVILATIQKEESLVESNYNFDFRVNWAMGYGVCDTCSLDDPNVSRYRGFTNQISNGAWQLKYNYSHWAANGSAWNVGKTMIIDGLAVTFASRATSSLYRYTPHLHGNENFVNIYNRYKNFRGSNSFGETYAASYSSQYLRTRTIALRPGQKRSIWLRYRNTGTADWYRGSARIGNSSPLNRNSTLTGGNTRWEMVQSKVRSRQGATFRISVTAPQSPGIYTERFRPLVEGITWMGEEAVFTFEVRSSSSGATNNATLTSEPYAASFASQNPRTSPINLRPGQRLSLYVRYRNTGSAMWENAGSNPAYLGSSSPQDRASLFTGGNVRWRMSQARVRSNHIATFRITITAPQTPGTYTEKFRPVVEGITWMGEETTFTFNVR